MTSTTLTRPESKPDRAKVLTKAVLRASDILGFTQKDLADVIGVSPSSMTRIRAGKRAIATEGKENQLALLFLRLFRSLDALVGGSQAKARDWLHAPNTHLKGIPAVRVGDVQGLVEVVQYLDALRGRI